MTKPISGLQKDVLQLYRSFWRAIREKPTENHKNLKACIRNDFQKHKNMNKRDFETITFMLRSGKKKLEQFKSPSLKNITMT
ncbi:hypothetical protein BB561_000875 [Smittium simulii]|uniref:Complex 1 LYR protein domain-containing protein n=1 Tax=Smittium simulii TaxID=133385 RepID=A0A2T9YX78_9FUNG|nr:hypothetical protein BB561_000875 [Smittium simulii]